MGKLLTRQITFTDSGEVLNEVAANLDAMANKFLSENGIKPEMVVSINSQIAAVLQRNGATKYIMIELIVVSIDTSPLDAMIDLLGENA